MMPLNNAHCPLNLKACNRSLDSWRFLLFKEIADLGKERISPQNIAPGLACIELENISKETGQMIGITDPSKQSSQKNVFYKGNVLFGKLRPYLQKYMYCDFDGVCSSEIWVLSSKNGCKSKYLFYLLQTSQFNRVADQSSGTKMPRADWTNVSKLMVPIPPIKEQEKMTEILSTWDYAIKRVHQMIEIKGDQKKGLIQGLTTGTLRFPEFGSPSKRKGELPVGWRLMKLDQLVKRVREPVNVKPEQLYMEIGIRSHGKGIFHKEERLGKELGTKSIFWVKPNTFILNIVFAWEQAIAKTSYQENGLVASHRFPMYKPSDDLLDLDFFMWFFLTPNGKSLLSLVSPGGAGRNKTLNQDAFLKLTIPVPPIIEQKKISRILCDVENEIGIINRYHNALIAQKQAMVQKLLTGEIRVKVD